VGRSLFADRNMKAIVAHNKARKIHLVVTIGALLVPLIRFWFQINQSINQSAYLPICKSYTGL